MGLALAGCGLLVLAQNPQPVPAAAAISPATAADMETALALAAEAAKCITGQYMLVGAVSPKDAKGEVDLTRKVMVFVKCDVLTMK